MPAKPEILRAPLFSVYFFILVTAYYFLKPLSRSLYITYLGADNLPYVWISTTLILSLIIPFFYWRVKNVVPRQIILALIGSLTVLLTLFRYLLESPSAFSAFTFYILVDVYSVLIIENFWSLVNSTYKADSGKRWYGVIASGGLLGGAAGGWASSWLIKSYNFSSLDLIASSACLFVLSLLLVFLIFRLEMGLQGQEAQVPAETASFKEVYANILKSPYVRWVAFLLFAAQLVEPLVEFQFMSFVEKEVPTLSERTKFVSEIFAYTSLFGIFVNIVLVPVFHYYTGIAGGLMLQPVLISIGSAVFLFWHTLPAISFLKIIDRGLAYSSGRASRELLYIPFDRTTIYKIKAWVDVYGYRFFRIFGSFLLIVITKWLSIFDPVPTSGVMVVIIAFFWLFFVQKIKKINNFR